MSGISLPEADLAGRAEALAAKLRDLIASQPPKDFLGYIYAGVLLNSARSPGSLEKPSALAKIGWEEAQFLLEYVHAVLAGTTPISTGTFDESLCAEIFSVSEELRACSMMLAMAIAINSSESAFGAATKDLLFSALSSWILIRSNRYQTLEEEFYKFTLGVHDAALRKVYGVGANEIAQGIQELSDSVRHGHGHAMGALEDAMHDAHEFTSTREDVEGIAEEWRSARPDKLQAALDAYADLFQGGICCVSRHTSLPEELLRDLSYDVGEDHEFFAPGRYCGTPFRTLPARKKPLIKIDGEYYLTDPSFARDAAYRAILWNLLRRDPGYKEEFKIRQKEMSEAAFPGVFANQLQDAEVYNEVWYRKSGNWYENDTLIVIDDVLVLVEAKAGAAATIASPAADFSRHAQSLKDLIIKAYEQCRRFLEYLASEKEVALYKRENDKYVEMLRIRLGDFRLVLPIGLTVESFSPFSTSSKQIPGIDPILGLHPFISLSIDEILVLSRFLRSSGELFHYLQVRQLAAGIKNAFIFDETDHLGAYLSKNMFPADLERQLSEDGANMIVLDKAGEIVDDYFALVDPDAELPPAQEFPSELKSVLATIDQSRGKGFLKTDSFLRDLSEEGRQQVSRILQPIRESLRLYPSRYVLLMTPQGPIFFWLHRDSVDFDPLAFQKKSEAAVAASGAVRGLGLVLAVNSAGAYTSASHHEISSPDSEGAANADVAAMKSRIFEIPEGEVLPPIDFGRAKRLGRNEPCWCGSGKKFKRCHGS